VLFIGQNDPLAQSRLNLLDRVIISNGEVEYFRLSTWQIYHGQFALPRLDDPSLPREFLHVSGTLTPGVNEFESGKNPNGTTQGRDNQQPRNQFLNGPPGFLS
jgi:hypothetical protein